MVNSLPVLPSPARFALCPLPEGPEGEGGGYVNAPDETRIDGLAGKRRQFFAQFRPPAFGEWLDCIWRLHAGQFKASH